MLKLHHKEDQAHHCTVAQLRTLVNALPLDAKVYMQNHHGDLVPACDPKVQIHPNGKSILLVIPEDYKV